jgi:4-carboxymuconolactone decarboxylase
LTEPRIPPRPIADWDAEADAAAAVMRHPQSTRKPGEPLKERPPAHIMGIFAWHPDLAAAFYAFNNHVFRGTLTARERELATIRITWLRRAEYEWTQHVRMAGRIGVPQEEIDAVMAGPDSPVWGSRDAALLRAVDEIAADRYVSDQTWKQLSEHFDRQQLMDLVFTVGCYDLLAMAFRNFGLELDPGMTGFPPDNHA